MISKIKWKIINYLDIKKVNIILHYLFNDVIYVNIKK